MNTRRVVYQALTTGIWAIGVFFAVRLDVALVSGEVLMDPAPRSIIMFSTAALAALSLFSFWLGAQRGHWVRATNITLFTTFVYLMYATYRQDSADLTLHARGWIVIGMMIFLNLNYARRFKQQFSRSGRVDYFERYFGQAV